MTHTVATAIAIFFGGITAVVFFVIALVVPFVQNMDEWCAGVCPKGGAHADETIESSDIPPFPAKHRCTKCGRVIASETYAL